MSESDAGTTEARWRNYQQLIWTQQQIQLQIQQQQQYQNAKMNGVEVRSDVSPVPVHPSQQQQQQQQQPCSDMPEKPMEEKTKETTDPWDNFDAHAAFLGPTLWDKRLPYDGQDFKLEYVDLEEFLTENGIPMDPMNNGANTGGHNFGKDGGHHSPGEMTNGSGCHPQTSASVSPDNQALAGPSRMQGHGMHGNIQIRNGINHHHHRSRSSSPGSNSSCSSRDMSSDPDSSQTGGRTNVSYGDFDVPFSIAELALSSVPGHEFDPRTRTFTEDELKPQPMIKKSRKQFVPDDAKDAKYWARRRKNNMAAKRSRDARRVKENQIAMRACFLEKENMALKQEIDRIQKENVLLKEQLRCCRRDH